MVGVMITRISVLFLTPAMVVPGFKHSTWLLQSQCCSY